MFIQKIQNISVDIDRIKADLSQILTYVDWLPENQIGLSHRLDTKNNVWKDSVGSLYDRTTNIELVSEGEFTEVNYQIPQYTKSILTQLAAELEIKLGRIRYMLLEPKTGLTVHNDTSVRYHLVIKTNPYSYIAHTTNTASVKAMCYHLPVDGQFYRVDTRQEHFVYNGGVEPRIHLVICPR
jgi:hypothetical protein